MKISYLLDATVSEKDQGIKLTFYNPSGDKWEEILDTDYRPYFFIPYPISEDDQKVIDNLNLETIITEKIDLFTRQTKKFVRINLKNFSDIIQISRKFSKAWEKDIPVVLSYIYDKNLVFGAQYKIREKQIIPILEVPKEDLKTFMKTFSEIKKNDIEKYKLSKRLFILCSQPVPAVTLERLGIKKNIITKTPPITVPATVVGLAPNLLVNRPAIKLPTIRSANEAIATRTVKSNDTKKLSRRKAIANIGNMTAIAARI